MSEGFWLYFLKEDYKDRKSFELPHDGVTIYCAERDKIYRPNMVSERADSAHMFPGMEFFEPIIFVKAQKHIYFSYSNECGVNRWQEEYIKEHKNSGTNFTAEEFDRAWAALQRYKDDPAGSLAWPVEEPRSWRVDCWKLHFGAIGGEIAFPQILPAGVCGPPPPLPGRPDACTWEAGKGLRKLTAAELAAQRHARL
jgi:hypothetical protein